MLYLIKGNIHSALLSSLAGMIFVTLSASSQSNEFVLGVEAINYYPHYSYDREYGYRGVYKEILTMFGKKAGYHFLFKAFPTETLFQAYFENQVAFKYPDNPKWMVNQKIRENSIDFARARVVIIFVLS